MRKILTFILALLAAGIAEAATALHADEARTFSVGREMRVRRLERRKANSHRLRAEIGIKPNLAPRGIVILVNFADSEMKSTHTTAVFDELFNSENCTVNKYRGVNYGSAAQYFADQSNGAYRPVFDVYGIVTLSRDYAYYGKDNDRGDPEYDEGDDQHAADAIVEACLLVDSLYDVDFTQYDSDKDGYIDFVYVVYAGRGQADGGDAETIWPHNWEVTEAMRYAIDDGVTPYCTYTKEEAKVDGKYIDSYACSSELSGNELNGIGTLCHEFGHVMGLPDLYDVSYGDNYSNHLTPDEWNIMDGGAYNGGGHCPPNYDPWAKAFFGWVAPINLGDSASVDTLYANGSANYNVYQINASGEQQGLTESGWCYYIENRQQTGWDSFLPSHGMVIWKINYDAWAWSSNAPNNTSTEDSPLWTIVCSRGTKIGTRYGENNVFGGASDITEWDGAENKHLSEITETRTGAITFRYSVYPAPEGIEETESGEMKMESRKILRNGQIVIIRAEKIYDLMGMEIGNIGL